MADPLRPEPPPETPPPETPPPETLNPRAPAGEVDGGGGEAVPGAGLPGDQAGRSVPPAGSDGASDGAQPPGAAGAGAGRDPADETERAFLEIVARFADRPDEPTWPAAEDVRLPPHPPVVVVRPARSPRPSGDPDEPTETDLTVIGSPDGEPAADQPVAAAEQDHYQPPSPPRAPRLRPGTRAALASVALGVALLVAPALTAAIEPTLTIETVAVLLVLGGVGTLVARMRDRDGDGNAGDGPDDGAVV